MLEIYQIAIRAPSWDISTMVARSDKKDLAEASARAIARRFRELGLPERFRSERQWVEAAGVSSSFFTNLRGSDTKPPSDPSVGNLRLVLEAGGSSIPEFLADEANGRLVRPPTRPELEAAFRDALDDLPARRERRAEYLASVVESLLRLPQGRPASKAGADAPSEGDRKAAAPARRATRRA
jgi:hypothetical protein